MSMFDQDDVEDSGFLDAARSIKPRGPGSIIFGLAPAAPLKKADTKKESAKKSREAVPESNEPREDNVDEQDVEDAPDMEAVLDTEPVDLNTEDGLERDGLEDKHLRAHMEMARANLIKLQKEMAEAPEESTLRNCHSQNLKIMSDSVKSLTKHIKEFQTAIENTIVHASNAEKLAAGRQPHGYPTVAATRPSNSEALAFMGTKLRDNGETHQGLHGVFSDILKDMIIFRRGYETVVDGYVKLAQHNGRLYEEAAKGLS
jgi:hypothetical protein